MTWWEWVGCGVLGWGVCCLFVLGLCAAAGKPTPRPEVRDGRREEFDERRSRSDLYSRTRGHS